MAQQKFVIADNLDTTQGFNINTTASKIQVAIKDNFKFTDGALDINTSKALPGTLNSLELTGTTLKANVEGSDAKTVDLADFSNVKHNDTDTVTITGTGSTGSELTANVKVDSVEHNLLVSTAAGLKVVLDTDTLTDAFGVELGSIIRKAN